MNNLPAWLGLGSVAIPPTPLLIHVGVALALTLVCLALGYGSARKLGPIATALWQRYIGDHAEGLAPRVTAILRYLITGLALWVVLEAYDWKPLAALPIGLGLGGVCALGAKQVLRGLRIPRWLSWVFAVVIFGAIVSGAVGGLTPISHILERIGFDVGSGATVRRFSLLLLITWLIKLVALFALLRLINRAVGHWISQSAGLDPTQKLLVQKLVVIAVIAIGFFIGLDLLSIDLTAFTVFGGAFGLAIGFGVQKTVGNLIAGIILLMDRSIKPGDVIVVGDSFGWVNKIGVRAVSVVTRDGKEHLIPNENLMTQEVENWSYSDRKVRIRIPVGVAYTCDLKLAQELMLKAASESPRVLKTPKPGVWLSAYGDSSVDHVILVWITDPEGGVGSVRSDVLNRLWWLFKEHDIEIPFPQRDVNIRSLPAAPTAPAAD